MIPYLLPINYFINLIKYFFIFYKLFLDISYIFIVSIIFTLLLSHYLFLSFFLSF